MSKESIIHEFYEIENKLESLRDAVSNILEQGLSKKKESDFPNEHDEIYLDLIFDNIRAIWNIPENIPLNNPIAAIQKEMSQKLTRNWASRQIIKLREE